MKVFRRIAMGEDTNVETDYHSFQRPEASIFLMR